MTSWTVAHQAPLYAEYLTLNARLYDPQARIKIAGRKISNFRYADDTTLMAESEEKLKSLLMRVKEENEKVGLKLSIKKTNVMTSSSITSWQVEGEKFEALTDFIFLGSHITADGDCSHEIKTLVPWKKSCDKPRQCIKHRHQPTRFPTVKAVVFPVVLYRCESWTIKKAEKKM